MRSPAPPPRKLLTFLFIVPLALVASAGAWPWSQPVALTAPNPGARPVNQLAISGNACGPAALLTAFRFGDPRWQLAARLPGESDREQLSYLIRRHALVKSARIPDRVRWNRARGVNVADLTDIANDMAAPALLPRISTNLLFLEPREDAATLLRRAHARIVNSLRKGLPPVASLRRYTRRPGPDGHSQWLTLEGHFIVITGISSQLPPAARSFTIDYIDPWGGQYLTGSFAIHDESFPAATAADRNGPTPSPCLEANCPDSRVGLSKVRPGETTRLAFEALIGRL